MRVSGQIEYIMFQNESNGYTVASLMDSTGKEITIVGNMMVKVGDYIEVTGEIGNHPKYGQQIKVFNYKLTMPKGAKGIEQYLASGFIKGIGAEMAKRIVKKFGADTLIIFDNSIERLKEIDGIKDKRLKMISDSWNEERKSSELVFFLQDHDISPTIARKVYNVYGDLSIAKIKENPYILIRDIAGVGFATADGIALKLGFPRDSIFRAEASLIYTLQKYADEGHTYCPCEELIAKAFELVGIEESILYKAVNSLESSNRIVVDSTFETERVYLSAYFKYETVSANMLSELISISNYIPNIDFETEIKKLETKGQFEFAEEQKEAIIAALTKKMVVITGGPGVGKTTIINAIISLYYANNLGHILLAAPTGKAAKRMTEVTGIEAVTIHRLLEYSPEIKGFRRNQSYPLECNMVIVDEASMIDIFLFYSLISAIPEHACFVMVGDVNQLPSVGVGNVLGDVIKSNKVPVIMLNKIFRQARESLIIVNSHRINDGEFPILDRDRENIDFYYIERKDANSIRETVLNLVTDRIPNRFKYDPLTDIQVLAPMYKGDTGINILNTELQKKLNKRTDGIQRGIFTYAKNDKVMQIKNNYDKEVFNGDVGIVESIDHYGKNIVISYDGKMVQYSFSEMDEIVLAYATSVHKSQGSEYPVVVIPLTMQHFPLLQRNLLYTGVTRGRKLVVLVGEKKALGMAINNNKTRFRYTALNEWVIEKSKLHQS